MALSMQREKSAAGGTSKIIECVCCRQQTLSRASQLRYYCRCKCFNAQSSVNIIHPQHICTTLIELRSCSNRWLFSAPSFLVQIYLKERLFYYLIYIHLKKFKSKFWRQIKDYFLVIFHVFLKKNRRYL